MKELIKTAALAGAVVLGGCVSATAPTASNVPAPPKDVTCPTSTASRIPSNDKSCNTPGRSYSSDEINSTGLTSAGAALQRLDPAVTGH